MKHLQTYLLFNLILISLVWPVSSALAHKVSVFGWVEGDTVHIESKLSGGKRPKGAKIQILDENGQVLNEGVTDSKGAYQYKVSQKSDLKIVLNAGMGHRAEWVIDKKEFDDANRHDPLNEAPEAAFSPDDSIEVRNQNHSTQLTADEIEEIVERALEKKLKPIMRELTASQSATPDIKDILGGIGYILGLIGLGAYIRYRKRDN